MTNHFVGSSAAFYLPRPFFFGHGSMCSNLGGGTFHAHTLGGSLSSLFRVMVRMDTPSWNYILGGWNYLK
jgi:hypothetical protein